MHIKTVVSTLALLTLPMAATALCDDSKAEADDSGRREALRQEVMERMRTMRMWRMTEVLKLDEKQAARIFPMLARFDEQSMAIARENMTTMRELEAELKRDKPDPQTLTRHVNTLGKNRNREHELESEKFKAMAKTLDPVQQARLALLLPRIEGAFRHHIREAFGKGGSHRGPPGGHWPSDHPKGPPPGADF
jgi:Spy/CpxP family protein refolding chaperone